MTSGKLKSPRGWKEISCLLFSSRAGTRKQKAVSRRQTANLLPERLSDRIKGETERGIMPKLKTHKGAAKRFRTTATGKIKRGHSHARHILTKKTNKRKRYLDVDVMVAEGDQKRVERMLPYGRD